MKRFGLLTAAGGSTRMGFDKILTPIANGENALLLSLKAMAAGGCEAIVVTGDESRADFIRRLSFPVPLYACPGGETRQRSVLQGLLYIRDTLSREEGALVAIHDGARCFVSPDAVRRSFEIARESGGAVASCPMTDTVYQMNADGAVCLDRSKLRRVQTPQTFRFDEILNCHQKCEGTDATDDCSLYLANGYTPVFFEGGADNMKLTTREDWENAGARLSRGMRIGTGFDTHVFGPGRRLILGGVEVPHPMGLVGHSDADVVLHALMDALLGAAALGDIGSLFPDTDVAYAGIDSRILLRKTAEVLRENGFEIGNVDMTVIAQKPKLMPYIPAMRERIAEDLGIPEDRVSVKATTTEHMNDEGREKCISCQAIAMIR